MTATEDKPDEVEEVPYESTLMYAFEQAWKNGDPPFIRFDVEEDEIMGEKE
jgi:hypothetical protein